MEGTIEGEVENTQKNSVFRVLVHTKLLHYNGTRAENSLNFVVNLCSFRVRVRRFRHPSVGVVAEVCTLLR